MAQDPFERYRQLRAKSGLQSAAPTAAPSSDPFERYRSLQRASAGALSKPVEDPSSTEKLGAVALGVPAAINTTISSTLGKLSRVPTMGKENPVSRFFTEVETGGRAGAAGLR